MHRLCDFCLKRKPIILRKFRTQNPSLVFTQALCSECLKRDIENRVADTIKKFGLINNGDKILLALSGEMDSTVLLEVLTRVCESMKLKVELAAVTVDEGIGTQRTRAIKYVKDQTDARGIKLFLSSFKERFHYSLDELVQLEKRRHGFMRYNVCVICGALRYKILEETARKLQVDKLATGYNFDDLVQTIFINYVTDWNVEIEPIAQSPYQGLYIIRPLYNVPREEIAIYAQLNNLQFLNEPCPYWVEHFRDYVRIILDDFESLWPGVKRLMVQSFQKHYSSRNSFLSLRRLNIYKCKKCGSYFYPILSEHLCNACFLLWQLVG